MTFSSLTGKVCSWPQDVTAFKGLWCTWYCFKPRCINFGPITWASYVTIGYTSDSHFWLVVMRDNALLSANIAHSIGDINVSLFVLSVLFGQFYLFFVYV